jgi:hypothetical protein
MRPITTIVSAVLCPLALAGVAVADTIDLDGVSFNQEPPASISLKVKTNERGKAKQVTGFAFEGLRTFFGSCTYLDTGAGCRNEDIELMLEACDSYVSGTIPGKLKLTKVPGKDYLSFSAEHVDPASNTTRVEARVAKSGKKAGLMVDYDGVREGPGPSTGRPTRVHCEAIGLFNAKAAGAPKSQ